MSANKREPVGTAVLMAISFTIVTADVLVRAIGKLRDKHRARCICRRCQRQKWEQIVAGYPEENRMDAPHDVLVDGMPEDGQ